MKKCLSIILCFVMVLSVFSVVPFSVSAEDADVSDTGAEATISDEGAEIEIENTGSAKDDYGYDCVAYVTARFPEYHGFALHGTGGNNAAGFYTNASNFGDTVSSTPRAGALAVWGYGNVGFSHVAFVESVNGNTVNISEGGWMYSWGKGYHTDSRNSSSMGNSWYDEVGNYCYQEFLGYVYVKGTDAAPHTHSYNTFSHYGSDHPHYAYYKCSCGDVKADTSQTSYSSTCSKCNHTVSYNANGGSGAPAAQTKKYLSALYLSSTIPQRTNYDFLGWSTDPNGDYAQYNPGDRYTSDSNLTLYAVWEPKNFTIKFDVNGGYNAPRNAVVSAGNDYTIPNSYTYREYHDFLGWSPFKDQNTEYYKPGDIIPASVIMGAASADYVLTLYAVWKEPKVIKEGVELTGEYVPDDSNSNGCFFFTPSSSGYYYINCDCQGVDFDFHIDDPSTTGAARQAHFGSRMKAFSWFEEGNTYIFSISSSNDGAFDYTISIVRSEIYNFKAEATKPLALKSSSYSAKDFEPTITLYNSSNSVIFRGNCHELEKQYNVTLYGFQKFDSAGEQNMLVKLIGEYGFLVPPFNKTYTMKVDILENDISGIRALYPTDGNGVQLIEGIDHTFDRSLGLYSTLENISMQIEYQDGSSETVPLKECLSFLPDSIDFSYMGYRISLSVKSGKLEVGDNTVVLSYRGFTDEYTVRVIESPLARISVVSAPELYDNEYYYIDYDGNIRGYGNLNQLIKDHPIKLRLVYKDGTTKSITINDLSSVRSKTAYDSLTRAQNGNLALQLGDKNHLFYYSTHIEAWGDPQADNYVTFEYLGKSVDVYFDFIKTDEGFDKAVDFEIVSMPNHDPEHYSHYPNLDGAVVRLTHESGKITEVTFDKQYFATGQWNGGYIFDDTIRYQFNIQIFSDNNHKPRLKLLGITKEIADPWPYPINSVKVLSDSDDYYYLTGALLEIEYSDGHTVYTRRTDNEHIYQRLTDSSWINLSPNEFRDCDFTFEERYNHSIVEIDNINAYRAKALAYNIGRNCDFSQGYRYDQRSEEDRETLIRSLPFFDSKHTDDYVHNPYGTMTDYSMDFNSAYEYLNKYYGMSKNEVYTSVYYHDSTDSIFLPGSKTYYYGFDESIKLYSETNNSYIFKYSYGDKTQYIEIAKSLRLLNVTNTAPSTTEAFSITVNGGFTSRDTAQLGNSVLVCVNVPEGKEFVKWTSNNNIQFVDETNTKTTFTMVNSDVVITPLFRDASGIDSIILGDVDGDEEVGILDATYIQRYDAGFNIPISEEAMLLCGDIDGDGDVGVIDVTLIQRYDAGFRVAYPIGKSIDSVYT